MDTRRMFMKKALMLSGMAGLSQAVPASVRRALAINPDPGTTYLDAEHVVILMQENRSFDHCFGTLQGVRGFNDPRAVTLPGNNRVWLQTNAAGETYTPFRLGMRETRATWMGALPHSRGSQVDAYNGGKYDQWLDAKRSRNEEYAHMPLTMGYYTREDIPFNYALADAFTVCDQHFCSAMTSTYPNRLFLWSGTIREEQDENHKAHIRNEDLNFGTAKWRTFPEKLQENGISWKVYQNEISCGGGFEGEERAWLSNFGCNPLEYFAGFNVKSDVRYVNSLESRIERLRSEIKSMQEKLTAIRAKNGQGIEKVENNINRKKQVLKEAQDELSNWTPQRFENMTAAEKELFQRAFTVNSGDPFYRELGRVEYEDKGATREVNVPKGDILHQFRTDVNSGQLPVVSWIVGPQNFSDHPSAPWYGAWYVSEIMDILTKNPEVWKKTIFILTYDENDGYFDHVPPFVAPDPRVQGSGKCSAGIDTGMEHTRAEQEIREGISPGQARSGPVGLGFRVPLIIASPWSRGGKVCSQVFDHTSPLQFLEMFLSKKTGKKIEEENIGAWRRTVCGDLSAVFSPYNRQTPEPLPFLDKIPFVEGIHKAKWANLPSGYKKLNAGEIQQINQVPAASSYMPVQEPGIRASCALPYELYADVTLNRNAKLIELELRAGNEIFGKESAGSPFTVYSIKKYFTHGNKMQAEQGRIWSYAVKAGDRITDTWPLEAFEDESYHFRTYGPNGFFREFAGDIADPMIEISVGYERESSYPTKPTGNLVINMRNLNPGREYNVEINDRSYGTGSIRKELAGASGRAEQTSSKENTTGAHGLSSAYLVLDLSRSFGWYDFEVSIEGAASFKKQYAGRVETGKQSFSDPLMGSVIK